MPLPTCSRGRIDRRRRLARAAGVRGRAVLALATEQPAVAWMGRTGDAVCLFQWLALLAGLGLQPGSIPVTAQGAPLAIGRKAALRGAR